MAQNLCAEEWLTLPGHGSTATEFNAYWEGLREEGQKRWDKISKKEIADEKLVLKFGKAGTGS